METNVVIPEDSTQPITIADLKRKMMFTGTVLKATLAGAVVDIGLDVLGVIHISQLQDKPTNRVEDVIQIGQTVDVWIKRVDPKKNRIDLTMIPPLDLEWREIEKGMVVKGKVTRLEKFGAFVDIGAERPGLVHISEMAHDYIKSPGEVAKEGDEVEVQVLEVNRRKKQIKLSMKSLEEKPVMVAKVLQRKDKEKGKEKVHTEASEKEEPVPTALEFAMREAMERTQGQEQEPGVKSKRKLASEKGQMEDILSRTLQQKVRTGK